MSNELICNYLKNEACLTETTPEKNTESPGRDSAVAEKSADMHEKNQLKEQDTTAVLAIRLYQDQVAFCRALGLVTMDEAVRVMSIAPSRSRSFRTTTVQKRRRSSFRSTTSGDKFVYVKPKKAPKHPAKKPRRIVAKKKAKKTIKPSALLPVYKYEKLVGSGINEQSPIFDPEIITEPPVVKNEKSNYSAALPDQFGTVKWIITSNLQTPLRLSVKKQPLKGDKTGEKNSTTPSPQEVTPLPLPTNEKTNQKEPVAQKLENSRLYPAIHEKTEEKNTVVQNSIQPEVPKAQSCTEETVIAVKSTNKMTMAPQCLKTSKSPDQMSPAEATPKKLNSTVEGKVSVVQLKTKSPPKGSPEADKQIRPSKTTTESSNAKKSSEDSRVTPCAENQPSTTKTNIKEVDRPVNKNCEKKPKKDSTKPEKQSRSTRRSKKNDSLVSCEIRKLLGSKLKKFDQLVTERIVYENLPEKKKLAVILKLNDEQFNKDVDQLVENYNPKMKRNIIGKKLSPEEKIKREQNNIASRISRARAKVTNERMKQRKTELEEQSYKLKVLLEVLKAKYRKALGVLTKSTTDGTATTSKAKFWKKNVLSWALKKKRIGPKPGSGPKTTARRRGRKPAIELPQNIKYPKSIRYKSSAYSAKKETPVISSSIETRKSKRIRLDQKN